MEIKYQCTHVLYHPDILQSIEFFIDKEIDLSIFPKYVKVFHSRCHMADNSIEIHTTIVSKFTSDDVNKGSNEAGMKRLEKFLQIIKKNFSDLKFRQLIFQNNLPLPENLMSIINQ